MTVEPGKGGQKIIPETLEIISRLKEYLYQNLLIMKYTPDCKK